jgi:hypothetical protein
MPIVLISADGENRKLQDLNDIVDKFDYVFQSSSLKATEIVDSIAEFILCDHIFIEQSLDPVESDSNLKAETKLNTLLNKINIKTGNVLIVSHHDFFMKTSLKYVKNEWETINLPLMDRSTSPIQFRGSSYLQE